MSDPNKIKTYTCRVCKAKYERKMGNTWRKWCSEECQDVYIKGVLEKERKKAWRQKKEQYKKELGLTTKVDTLQKVINKIVMVLDEDQPCMARPFDNNNRFEAGHVIPRGRYKSLSYHLWNIHKQGTFSNRSQTDDGLMLEGLEVRYGYERRKYVEGLPLLYPTLKLTKPDKMAALKRANDVLNRLKSGEELSRDDINKLIGIYNNETSIQDR